jgi:uncharacterized integral membrane protein (TIGR00698 family)
MIYIFILIRTNVPFSPSNRKGTFQGILFVTIFATAATAIASLDFFKSLHISPLVIGIVLGMFYANTLGDNIPKAWEAGITFSGKKILRFAIVFYGFQITFQQISSVGIAGFLVSLIMLVSTFIIGTYLSMKWFKLDRDTAMLTASGASVCGAAAVAATEPVLKPEAYKVTLAISMVVLFGTIAMFIYPLMYPLLDMTPAEFGIYVGGTVHEVAQVVAVGGSITGAADNAIIVKMTRVMLIAPMLILLAWYLSKKGKKNDKKAKLPIVIPWFAVYFVIVAAINSLLQEYTGTIPKDALLFRAYTQGLDSFQSSIVHTISFITTADSFLLTVAMTALGMNTRFKQFKALGIQPVLASLVMFIWLIVGGYFITKWIVSIFPLI